MNEELYLKAVYAWISTGLLVFPVLLFVTAPYGRHSSRKWGAMIPNRLGWVIMELPSLVLFGSLFLAGPVQKSAASWIFFSLWVGHYVHRSLIYPFRTHTRGKQMPLAIALMAVFFNVMNGSVNGLWLGWFSGGYANSWLLDFRFIGGLLLFTAGFAINQASDKTLLGLRSSAGNGYRIPYGGFFRWVSCPNFMGEILEWWGFALMTWSPAGMAFAVWTCVNLIPRALDHHKWYRRTFPDYPSERKALIPYLL
ncbi:MAG: DUF1295 domain-containing protein [Bacteroidota bacterium]